MVNRFINSARIFKIIIGFCIIWNNDGFMGQMKNSYQNRPTCYGSQWNQPYLTFTSFTTKPATIAQLSTDILLNSNATAPLGDSRVSSGTSGSTGKNEFILLTRCCNSIQSRTGCSYLSLFLIAIIFPPLN